MTYNYKYQRPNDPSLQCDSGFNSIRHDDLVEAVEKYFNGWEEEIKVGAETDTIKRLEAEVAQSEALATHHATSGHKTYLRGV